MEESLVLELVAQQRVRQPRLGTRKLWYLLQEDLADAGVSIGRDGLFGLLRENRLLIERRSLGVRTTWSGHGWRVYPNLARDMVLICPHQLLLADITYLRTLEGVM